MKAVVLTVLVFFINLYFIYYVIQYSPVQDKLIKGTIVKDVIPKVDLYSCNITDELAVSALERVKTESCKQKITEAACKLKNDIYHDSFPESACENHDAILIGQHIGCYQDSSKLRTLDGFKYEFATDNSRGNCRSHCYRAGFLYFGVEYGCECFCGDTIVAEPLVQTHCETYACTGNASENCGGFNAVDIFRTGLREKMTFSKAEYVSNVTADASPVRIMFLLQLNGRNDRQVKRMLRTIYATKHFYYIHVDQRQLYMLTEMRAIAAKLPNVYVTPDGHSTIWGGASLLDMVQDAIRRSLTMPAMSDWDYLFNMSESDFPVLSLEELELQLSKNRGKSFLASHGYNTARFIQKQGFDYVFMECEERMWRIGKRDEFPSNLRLDGGSDWVVLDRKFAEFSISDDELPKKLRKLFSSIILPVESFFHTLAYNSAFCHDIVSGHLRLTNWNRKQGCRCASLKKVVDWCGCSPLVFKKEHTSKFALERSINKALYVARKFESLIDIDAIAQAEAISLRNRQHLIEKDHASFNSTFVNFYKADIDGYSLQNTMLAKTLLKKSSLSHLNFVAVTRVDVFRANSSANIQLVISIKVKEYSHDVQLLVETLKFGNVRPESVVDGFLLESISYGINIDHKEEIFRGYTSFSDMKGNPTIALSWKRIPTIPSTVEDKTSPRIKFLWKDAKNSSVATQTLPSYDSIYGTQFASLELSTLNLKTAQMSVGRLALHRLLSSLFEVAAQVMKNDAVAISQAKTLMNTVSLEMIGRIPDSHDCKLRYEPVLYAEVTNTSLLHASIFGVVNKNDSIPLHNHPRMHGIIKVVRGRVRYVWVRSFTVISSHSGYDLARYEGESIVTPESDCLHLGDSEFNIHEIIAEEDGSFFFDALFPGYIDVEPNYYFRPEVPLIQHDVYKLNHTSPSSLHFTTGLFSYNKVHL